jgi:short-subunit dehydrogenase
VNKGFNLILVERDRNQLDDLEADLRQHTIQEPRITKIVLDRFDQDTLNKQLVNLLKEHKNSPVKLFINCKNSRRKLQSDAAHMT